MATRRNLAHTISDQFTRIDGSTKLYIGRENVFPGLSGWPVPHDAPYKHELDWIIMAVIEVASFFFLGGSTESWKRLGMREHIPITHHGVKVFFPSLSFYLCLFSSFFAFYHLKISLSFRYFFLPPMTEFHFILWHTSLGFCFNSRSSSNPEGGLYERWSDEETARTQKESRQRLKERLKEEQERGQDSEDAEEVEAEGTLRPLTLTHMQGPLFLLLLGVAAGAVAFVAEVVLARCLDREWCFKGGGNEQERALGRGTKMEWDYVEKSSERKLIVFWVIYLVGKSIIREVKKNKIIRN